MSSSSRGCPVAASHPGCRSRFHASAAVASGPFPLRSTIVPVIERPDRPALN